MRNLFFFFIIFLSGTAAHAQAKETDYKEALRIIDVWLNAQRDFDRLPGISVAIVKDQNIIFSKGYGFADVEKKVPMQPETICSICSISKLFTSVAAMQLWENGKLRLDDSVNALLPDYSLKQQYTETVPITIRSLLTHSSGLPREAAYPYWSAPDFNFPTEKEIHQKLQGQHTLYPSSTYFQYSNLGMSLLGEVVANVSKTAYESYVEKNILAPLQLTSTHPSLPENLWRGKMATGYSALYRDGTRKMMPFFQAKGIAPAAGYSSNVIDLAHFASWQFRLLGSGSKEVLRPSTLKEMQRVQWVDPDGKTTWGLGFVAFQRNGTSYVGHGGSCPGYRTALVLSPKTKIAVTIMINAQGTEPEKYALDVFEILKKAKDITDTATINIDLEAYAGNYDGYAWSGEDVVLPWKGKLAVFNVPSNNPADEMQLFKWVAKDSFRRVRKDDDSLGEELRFERDASGKVVRLIQNDNFQNKLQ
jgi:CubicO group peptidase (beta-lactamase class C family)